MKKILCIAALTLVCRGFLAAGPNDGYDLVKAAEKGDLDGIKKALAAGADVNAKDVWYGPLPDRGDTALMKACARGEMEIVRFLLSRGADVRLRDKHGDSAFYYAAVGGDPGIVALLYKKGLRLSDKGKSKDSRYVFYAGGKRRGDVIRLFLDYGVDPRLTDRDKNNLLGLAAGLGDTALIEDLLKRGVPVDMAGKYGETPLMIASRRGMYAAAALLLERGAAVDARDRFKETALMKACEKSEQKTIGLLIDHHADLEARNFLEFTPLMQARDLPTVAYLVSRGADVSAEAKGESLLWRFTGRPDVLEFLLERGLDVNKRALDKDTPLIVAAGYGTPEAVAFLLSKGARVNDANESGRTALHNACQYGRKTEIVDILLRHNADPNLKTKKGATPLMLASWQGKTDAVALLLGRGADVTAMTAGTGSSWYEISDAGGFAEFIKRSRSYDMLSTGRVNALMLAAFHNRRECLQLLLRHGADPDHRLKGGVTAAMLAAAQGYTDIVSELAAHGADLKAETDFGVTALDLAVRFKKSKTAEAIRRLQSGKD